MITSLMQERNILKWSQSILPERIQYTSDTLKCLSRATVMFLSSFVLSNKWAEDVLCVLDTMLFISSL